MRRVRPGELSAFREVRLRSLREDPLAFGSTLAGELALPEERWRERLEQGASSATDASWVAVAEGGRFVATMSLVLLEGRYHIFGMWVAPEHRREGLGERMLNLGLARARAVSPAADIALSVNPRQAAAVRLYERHGFRRTGRTEPVGHTDGEIVVEMVRPAEP